MRRAFIVVAVIGCAVSRPNVVAGDPAVTESFDLQPYTVTGASSADLRTAIRAARPATPDGVRFDAITRWHVSYRYDFVRDATGGCAPANPRVKLELKIEMPALADGVPEQARAAVEAYLRALRAHEDGHVRIDREIATAVADAVRAARAQSTCDAVRSAVRAAADRAMDDGKARNRAYDEETHHGVLQGAVFPR